MFGFPYFGETYFAGFPLFTAGTSIIPVPTPRVVLKGGDGGSEARKKRDRERQLAEERIAHEDEANEQEDIELLLTVWLNLK